MKRSILIGLAICAATFTVTVVTNSAGAAATTPPARSVVVNDAGPGDEPTVIGG